MYYVYFAKSLRTSKVYVGFTSKQPLERVKEHSEGKNKFTKLQKPLKLIYYEKFICEDDARFRERFYKSGVGKQIKKLITENIDLVD